MSADVETVVVGAGVVGLAIARALACAGRQVLVLERHEVIGSETSSRNSEVIHAGLYYPPGSLRAKLCVEGKHQLYAFCTANGIRHRRCGKLVVATAADQTAKLEAIARNARANGVDDLVPLTPAEAKRLEPEVACAAALLSPSTGIVDSHGLMLALEGHAEARGAQIVLRSEVTRIEATGSGLFTVEVAGDTRVGCESLVIAAGLHASKLAAMLSFPGSYRPPATYYAKGQYYALSGRSPFQRHIYPMPQGAWLGLHATVDIAGRCKFGPDMAWTTDIDYSFEPDKLGPFLHAIRSYYPGLAAERLHPDYTGVRPKLYREGEPVADFAIHGPSEHGREGLVMLFGIESPGLTAALAIGDHVAKLLGGKG
ncbi:MAG TPA: NAD(P)/FAD-dependent oxidoreductase [Hyphomicrobiaceae bacterium]|nr:NAD(P)/FAD-dependent oxidoreductase [Hyphomicrobiaceae bacterium]